MTSVFKPEWHCANRAKWDKLVGVHLGPCGYDLTTLPRWTRSAERH